jgi:hypothetical protein
MKRGEELGGPNAVGRPGDWILENDEVVFVVDQLGSGAGFAESGGNLVDAADARVRRDELGQVFTHFGEFPRQGVYDHVSSGMGPDGSGWVEAEGRELYDPTLKVTTRYTLRAPDRALLIETSVENSGATPVALPSLGDVIQWGAAEKVAPGKPRGFKGESSGPYVGGVGRYTSYAVTSVDGAIEATSGNGWTDTRQGHDIRIAPRDKVSYARLLLVGERPDTSSIVAELAMAAGQPVGELRVDVHSVAPDGGVAPTGLAATALLPTGLVATLFAEGSTEALTLAPPFVGRLPVGRYRIAAMGAAGPDPPDPVAIITVRAGTTAHVDVRVEPSAVLDVRCVGEDGAPVPCKLTLQGKETTPTPDFGPANTTGPARSQSTTADGRTHVALTPGRYRVVASRGPEYALSSVDVDLTPGDRRSETLVLRRVVNTRGYVACDFHQHTMLGTDAPVGTRDRVIANAAEGVEIAVASEHNVVADLEPIVKELHLEHDLVEVPGDELTSDASRRPWGHANVFPLAPDASKARGGAPVVRDRSLGDIVAGLRGADAGDVVVQVNHPRSGKNGYFDQLGFDRSLGKATRVDYDGEFDALEVWNGRNVDARDRVLDDFRALLRTGHVVTATADTDTHGIVGQEAGYPRTYVRVANDERLETWDAARTADLVRGIKVLRDVVLTNGPMLRVSANGVAVGGVARGHDVVVKVHVECAPWVDVDRVQLFLASETPPPVIDKPPALQPLPGGARGADLVVVLHVNADDALFVVVSGRRPMSPVLGGEDSEIRPWAMTGALWIDADGDGAALGRTTRLGQGP